MAAVAVPPGKQSFIDPLTGLPLEFGTVEHYVPSTFTPKLTWADEAETTANPNPLVLDAAGQCAIWGTGLYRQILKDQHGVQIWDQITGFVASGGGGGGDVFGPGSSIAGDFAVWASTDGTEIADGGPVGILAHLSSINNSYWAGAQLSVANGGTGATAGPAALANLGFSTTLFTTLATMLVQGSGISITPVGATYVFTNTGGGGGGGVTGPVSSLNGELPAFQGTSGAAITNTGCVPTANGYSLISAANYAAMRTLLGLTTTAITALGTSGATVPLLSTANTWSLAQTFTLAPVFTDGPGSRSALGLVIGTDVEPAGAYSGTNPQTGTTYTLALSDKGKLVTMNNAAANVLTIPPNSSVAFSVLSRIDLSSLGVGQMSVAAGAGVTIRSAGGALKLTAQYSGASLVKLATDTWLLIGDIAV